jgi:hypothetical protein
VSLVTDLVEFLLAFAVMFVCTLPLGFVIRDARRS